MPVTRQNISGNAATATKLTSASGSAPSYSARAWVNFDSTGSPTIRASGNVASLSDNGIGDFSINFTTNMPDTNYCAIGQSNSDGTARTQVNMTQPGAVGSQRMTITRTGSNTLTEVTNVSVAIFR